MSTTSQSSHIPRLPSRKEYTSIELVEGMIEQNAHALNAFFDLYGERINLLVWKLLRSKEDQSDTVNTVLVEILQSIKNLKDPQSLPKWVSRITVNSVINEIRRRKLRRRFFMDVEDPEKRLPHVPPQPADIGGRIHGIVRTMKPEYQVLFVLHYVEGYSYSEISKLRGKSLSATKRRGRRAKAEFAKIAKKDIVLASYIEGIEKNENI